MCYALVTLHIIFDLKAQVSSVATSEESNRLAFCAALIGWMVFTTRVYSFSPFTVAIKFQLHPEVDRQEAAGTGRLINVVYKVCKLQHSEHPVSVGHHRD